MQDVGTFLCHIISTCMRVSAARPRPPRAAGGGEKPFPSTRPPANDESSGSASRAYSPADTPPPWGWKQAVLKCLTSYRHASRSITYSWKPSLLKPSLARVLATMPASKASLTVLRQMPAKVWAWKPVCALESMTAR